MYNPHASVWNHTFPFNQTHLPELGSWPWSVLPNIKHFKSRGKWYLPSKEIYCLYVYMSVCFIMFCFIICNKIFSVILIFLFDCFFVYLFDWLHISYSHTLTTLSVYLSVLQYITTALYDELALLHYYYNYYY